MRGLGGRWGNLTVKTKNSPDFTDFHSFLNAARPENQGPVHHSQTKIHRTREVLLLVIGCAQWLLCYYYPKTLNWQKNIYWFLWSVNCLVKGLIGQNEGVSPRLLSWIFKMMYHCGWSLLVLPQEKLPSLMVYCVYSWMTVLAHQAATLNIVFYVYSARIFNIRDFMGRIPGDLWTF